MFALVDGNSFYAACETVFRPDLIGQPVVVLSNNDGCVVAANREAKAIGDIMYRPYFQIKKMLSQHRVSVFSSNYELYGDLSNRMHTLLGTFATAQEIYSIDESFLDVSGMNYFDLTEYGHEIKKTVMQHLSLPVAVGFGTSKTLAKAANNLAKKISATQGVLAFSDISESEQNNLLAKMAVKNVWGVGRQWAERLNANGIRSALDLKRQPVKKIRQQFNVILERTVHELNGTPCQDLELITPDKKEIISSRAFGQPITHYHDMKEAVARYIARAAIKLRSQKSVCKQISVGIQTNPFKNDNPQYRQWGNKILIHPSDHTGHLIERGHQCLKHIWREGFEYKKAFVLLSDISDKDAAQFDLFAENPLYSSNPKSDALMTVMDSINRKIGKGFCQMAAEGRTEKQAWVMKRALHSPRYSSAWHELPIAYLT